MSSLQYRFCSPPRSPVSQQKSRRNPQIRQTSEQSFSARTLKDHSCHPLQPLRQALWVRLVYSHLLVFPRPCELYILSGWKPKTIMNKKNKTLKISSIYNISPFANYIIHSLPCDLCLSNMQFPICPNNWNKSRKNIATAKGRESNYFIK